ncbi:hypothetical protein SDC9_168088 [bioreactor metagenome]|uniref:Uncharacterized protein n=1 Tax=bioreactor metagenome TaxID=1076179 RepID=A0A645G4J0_9ZZZZ
MIKGHAAHISQKFFRFLNPANVFIQLDIDLLNHILRQKSIVHDQTGIVVLLLEGQTEKLTEGLRIPRLRGSHQLVQGLIIDCLRHFFTSSL